MTKVACYGTINVTERRDRTPLPAAWSVEELDPAAYVYFENEPADLPVEAD